ncbi:hypothetical protein [Actinoallomurus sp. CA-150999]|uniref:hypothetical protein n=1 Tax=Actinoallomurus sp. CA-150999 TaxID=3239887 RepID=UPI003D91E080
MTIQDFALLLWRHPVVVLLAIFVTAGAALHLVTERPAYETRAVVNFLMPGSTGFENFNISLVVEGAVTALSLDSQDGAARVRRQGGTAAYDVVLANRGNDEQPVHDQPYVTLIVNSRDPAQASRTLAVLIGVLRADVRDRQVAAGARPDALITTQVVASSDRPIPLVSRRTRALAAIGAAGLLAMLVAALMAERHPRLRLRRLLHSHG